MGTVTPMIGKRFERLLVVTQAHRSDTRLAHWYCQCDCGRTKVVAGSSLRSGVIRSCGCLRSEKARVMGSSSKRHGLSRHPSYSVWTSMMHRCYSSRDIEYRNYGGRGIAVCDRWHRFENFYTDFGHHRPVTKNRRGISIERKDNNGNYEPSNVRWATPKEQGSNKRNNRYLEYNGRRMILSEWARELNMSQGNLTIALRKQPFAAIAIRYLARST